MIEVTEKKKTFSLPALVSVMHFSYLDFIIICFSLPFTVILSQVNFLCSMYLL